MSEQNLKATDLVSIGVNLWCAAKPDQYRAFEYMMHLQSFVGRLREAGLWNTLNAAEPLYRDVKEITQDAEGRFDELYAKRREEFKTRAQTINQVLMGEAKTKTLILTDAQPPVSLELLTDLQPRQSLLLRDLVVCLKAQLARPAIVMAWSLGYDIVRWWVYDEANNRRRLEDFNSQIESPQIEEYEAFFRLGERRVLDVCLKAEGELRGFSEKTHRALVHLLDDRNRFAHANDSDATTKRAEVYVDKMVEIVTGPPFNN
jgi:hypothetical protein